MGKNIKTLKETIEYFCEKNSDKNAIIVGKKQYMNITYNNLYNHILSLGSSIYKLNPKKSNIAIVGNNSYEWIVTYLSIVYGLGTAVLIDSNLSCDEISNKIMHSESTIVFFSLPVDIKNVKTRVRNVKYWISMNEIQNSNSILWKDLVNSNEVSRGYMEINVEEDDVSTIIYTSGTTSSPKGVMLTQKNIVAVILAQEKMCTLGEKYLSVLPFSHSYGCVISMLGLLYQGVTNYINEDIRNLWEDIKQIKPDTLILVPALVEYIINKLIKIETIGKVDIREEYKKELGNNLKYILCGGAPFNEDNYKKLNEIQVEVLNGYGITECAPLISINTKMQNNPCSVGKVVPCCEVKIDTIEGSKQGEILVKGSNVMKGYFKNVEATKLAFCDEWFKTGDLGYLDENGFLFVTGRIKNVIVLQNGYNILPEELEYSLNKLKYIKESIISKQEKEKGEIIILATIYLEKKNYTEEIKKDVEKQIHDLNRKLPFFKRIGKVEFVNKEFDKTRTGKIKRGIGMLDKIKEILIEEFDLKANDISLESNFISDLNFDSLLFFKFLSCLESKFNISIDNSEWGEFVLLSDTVKYLERKIKND